MSDTKKTYLDEIPEDILALPDEMFISAELGEIGDEEFKTKPIGFFKDSMIRLSKKKVSMISFGFICVIIFLAIFAPTFNEFTYVQQHVTPLDLRNMPPRIPGLERLGIANGTRVIPNIRMTSVEDPYRFPPNSVIDIRNERYVMNVLMVDVLVDFYIYNDVEDMYFWFGTDHLGRDLFTRLFRGTRISLFIAFVAVFANLIIGVIYGAVMGYYGGTTDMIMNRIIEILDGIPNLVIIIMFVLMYGTGILSLIVALCLTGWIGVARLTRAQFYRFKVREYVLAARTLGVRDTKLIFRHILPNSMGILITRTMLAIPSAIFFESFLAYIGLGIQAPEPSLGILLADGQNVLLQFPYQVFFPAVVLSVLMVSFNLFSDGLRDALDPTKRGED